MCLIKNTRRSFWISFYPPPPVLCLMSKRYRLAILTHISDSFNRFLSNLIILGQIPIIDCHTWLSARRRLYAVAKMRKWQALAGFAPVARPAELQERLKMPNT